MGVVQTTYSQQGGRTMANIDVTLNPDLLTNLLSDSGEGMKKLVESVLNQVLEAQMVDHLGADRHERSSDRTGYRNGYRERQLTTRVGTLILRVPQTRDGNFSTDLFRRYQRSEQALVLALMEMVVQGVSTRKVTHITEELCGATFSKSTVSSLATGLSARVNHWRNRRLKGPYPFLLLDALMIHVRKNESVVPVAALIATGISEEGQREILGLTLGDSENEASWDDMLRDLKSRGLSGVDLVVSDDHKGLKKAVQRHFQGVRWQRCQVHFLRNLLGHATASQRGPLALALGRLFRADTKEEARAIKNEILETFEKKAPKSMDCLEEGFEESLTILSFSRKYRVRLRSTNSQERLNEEVRRRERVIRIFPNEDSAIRLIGALLSEFHEQWSTGKKYFDMAEYWEWKKQEPFKTPSLLSVVE